MVGLITTGPVCSGEVIILSPVERTVFLNVPVRFCPAGFCSVEGVEEAVLELDATGRACGLTTTTFFLTTTTLLFSGVLGLVSGSLGETFFSSLASDGCTTCLINVAFGLLFSSVIIPSWIILLYLKCKTCTTAWAHSHIDGYSRTAAWAHIFSLTIIFIFNDIDILVDSILNSYDLFLA